MSLHTFLIAAEVPHKDIHVRHHQKAAGLYRDPVFFVPVEGRSQIGHFWDTRLSNCYIVFPLYSHSRKETEDLWGGAWTYLHDKVKVTPTGTPREIRDQAVNFRCVKSLRMWDTQPENNVVGVTEHTAQKDGILRLNINRSGNIVPSPWVI